MSNAVFATRPDTEPAAAELTDPRTGQSRPLAYDPADIPATVATARAAAVGWAALTTAERSRRLLRLAAVIEDNAARYVAAERAGTGKPEAEAVNEIAQCVDIIRFYAGAARADSAPAGGRLLPGRESWVRWEPLGVVAAIVPWNYPLLMATWRFAPALAAGNAVVLKPAETTPDSALLVAAHAAEVLGPGVLSTVPGDRETGRRLMASQVDAVAFTGSRASGLDVQRSAGLRRVSLELGGNCPVIVLPDAPNHTWDRLVDAVLIQRRPELRRARQGADPAGELPAGGGRADQGDAVAAGRGRLRAAEQPRPAGPAGPDHAASGARTQNAGEIAVAADELGGYWRPSLVLADLPEDDPAVVEEIFGPVLTVRAAEDADDLLRLANGVPHALAASVWSERASGALRLAGALNAGEVWVNCHLEQTAKLPHGGRAKSGHGTDLSVLALTEYQRPKTITVSSGGDQGRLPTAAPAQLADRRPARVHQQCRGDHRVRLRPADPVRPARRPPVVGDLHGRAAARAALDRAAHPVRAGRARSRPGRGWKAGSTG